MQAIPLVVLGGKNHGQLTPDIRAEKPHMLITFASTTSTISISRPYGATRRLMNPSTNISPIPESERNHLPPHPSLEQTIERVSCYPQHHPNISHKDYFTKPLLQPSYYPILALPILSTRQAQVDRPVHMASAY